MLTLAMQVAMATGLILDPSLYALHTWGVKKGKGGRGALASSAPMLDPPMPACEVNLMRWGGVGHMPPQGSLKIATGS